MSELWSNKPDCDLIKKMWLRPMASLLRFYFWISGNLIAVYYWLCWLTLCVIVCWLLYALHALAIVHHLIHTHSLLMMKLLTILSTFRYLLEQFSWTIDSHTHCSSNLLLYNEQCLALRASSLSFNKPRLMRSCTLRTVLVCVCFFCCRT